MRLLAFSLVAACGGASAEAPLAVALGLSHDATEQALHAHQYCRVADPHRAAAELTQQVTYPRCDRTAAEWGDSWVTAIFRKDKLVELRRWERYSDDERALQRWNELVIARLKDNVYDDSDDARHSLRPEPGARSVKMFRAGDGTVVGVYLLTPTPPNNANILEKLAYRASPPMDGE